MCIRLNLHLKIYTYFSYKIWTYVRNYIIYVIKAQSSQVFNVVQGTVTEINVLRLDNGV